MQSSLPPHWLGSPVFQLVYDSGVPDELHFHVPSETASVGGGAGLRFRWGEGAADEARRRRVLLLLGSKLSLYSAHGLSAGMSLPPISKQLL